ncbi:MAG: hypothetical protein FJX23_09450 [Alphaproteobacteria bacterium]|nr:hypothetical protein [Alphaproteobacteria bacterium]
MTDATPNHASRYPIDQDPKGITLSDVLSLPHGELSKAIAALPKGQLAVEGLPTVGASSYPVDDGAGQEAAEFLRSNPPIAQKYQPKDDAKEPVFRNQAQIMAHASQKHAWRCGESLSLVAIPRFWPEKGTERHEDHRVFDMLGKAMDSGIFSDPETVGRLSSPKDAKLTQEEAIAKGTEVLERHEAWKKNAVAQQQASAKKHGWADKEQTRRSTAASKPNPCLGF